MAELTPGADAAGRSGTDERPYAPGEYPVVVVGSGPGAIQTAYALSRLGIDHAVISADPAPGGMFRRWPFFQRLLSWTKPYAPVDRGTRAYERYDWNSLLADEPENRSLMPDLMDGTSYFPSRPEMERNIGSFVDRTGVRVRYDCGWTATRHEDGADGGRFVLETADGEYRARAAIFAVGVAEPYAPSTPGIELAAHYADTRPAETYAGRRIFIMGKQNSGFELASGLLPWARRIVLSSPSPAKLSVDTKSLVGVRARYVQPFEDHVLGGGVSVLDASTTGIERAPEGDGFVVRVRPSAGGEELAIEADEVISATGFVTPLRDLPALGVSTFGQARLPAQTPYWESAAVPGIFFAGTIGQGSAGLKKHGQPANSGAVHGARYNARVLAGHIARRVFGQEGERPPIDAGDLVDRIVMELSTAPELWHQRAYLSRVISLGDDGPCDEGVVPLAAFVDGLGDDGTPDGLALTLEADGTGAIYPVLYLRRNGRVDERPIEPDPLLRFDTPAAREQVSAVVDEALASAAVR
ncbi:MAG TPA: NAD(P)-binding domain-containing protein [Candidatus Limnocylindrales bacterium]|nr:NAD(P)-binding domain-containing protein [Candidatus Limnocylindrales bacterium]